MNNPHNALFSSHNTLPSFFNGEPLKKGVGTALVERLKALCSNKHIMKMFVPTSRSNIPAISLYQKTGAIISTDTDAVSLTWYF